MTIRSKRAISRMAIFGAAIALLTFATTSWGLTQTEEPGKPLHTKIGNPEVFSEKAILNSARAVPLVNSDMSVAKKQKTIITLITVAESQLHVGSGSTMHDGVYLSQQSTGEFSDFWKYATLAAATLAFAGVALYLQRRSERAK